MTDLTENTEKPRTRRRVAAKKPAAKKAAAKPRTATIHTKRADIQTGDVEPPKETTIDLASTIRDEDIERPDLVMVSDQDMNDPVVKEYARDLAFNEDILTIEVADTDDPNADNPVSAGCNGEAKHFYRGVQYKVPRKFVDSLIKTVNGVKTKQYQDEDNVYQTKIDKTPKPRYPIAILHDPAGETGRRWFKHQIANAF